MEQRPWIFLPYLLQYTTKVFLHSQSGEIVTAKNNSLNVHLSSDYCTNIDLKIYKPVIYFEEPVYFIIFSLLLWLRIMAALSLRFPLLTF